MTFGPFELCEYVQSSILAALDDCGRGAVTTTYPGVGLIAWDDCCGQLVVSPERIYRSDVFPSEATTDERCNAGTIVVDILASLVRCVPVPGDTGRPPTASALSAAHKVILDDAGVVWSAVSAPLPVENEWERSSISQSFAGGEGGCISIETRLTIGVESERWCGIC